MSYLHFIVLLHTFNCHYSIFACSGWLRMNPITYLFTAKKMMAITILTTVLASWFQVLMISLAVSYSCHILFVVGGFPTITLPILFQVNCHVTVDCNFFWQTTKTCCMTVRYITADPFRGVNFVRRFCRVSYTQEENYFTCGNCSQSWV